MIFHHYIPPKLRNEKGIILPLTAVMALAVLVYVIYMGINVTSVKRGASELQARVRNACYAAAVAGPAIQSGAAGIAVDSGSNIEGGAYMGALNASPLRYSSLTKSRIYIPVMPEAIKATQSFDLPSSTGGPTDPFGCSEYITSSLLKTCPVNTTNHPQLSKCNFQGNICATTGDATLTRSKYPRGLVNPMYNAGNIVICEADAEVPALFNIFPGQASKHLISAKSVYTSYIRGLPRTLDPTNRETAPGITLAIAPQMRVWAKAVPPDQVADETSIVGGGTRFWGPEKPTPSGSEFIAASSKLIPGHSELNFAPAARPNEPGHDFGDISTPTPTQTPGGVDPTPTPPYFGDVSDLMASCKSDVVVARNRMLSAIVEILARNGQTRKSTQIIMANPFVQNPAGDGGIFTAGAGGGIPVPSPTPDGPATSTPVPTATNTPVATPTPGEESTPTPNVTATPTSSIRPTAASEAYSPPMIIGRGDEDIAAESFREGFTFSGRLKGRGNPDPFVSPSESSDEVKKIARYFSLVAESPGMCFHLYDAKGRRAFRTRPDKPKALWNSGYDIDRDKVDLHIFPWTASLWKNDFTYGTTLSEKPLLSDPCSFQSTPDCFFETGQYWGVNRRLSAGEVVASMGVSQPCPYEVEYSGATKCSKTERFLPDIAGVLKFWKGDSDGFAYTTPGLDVDLSPEKVTGASVGGNDPDKRANTHLILALHTWPHNGAGVELAPTPAALSIGATSDFTDSIGKPMPMTVIYMPYVGADAAYLAIKGLATALNASLNPYSGDRRNLFVIAPYSNDPEFIKAVNGTCGGGLVTELGTTSPAPTAAQFKALWSCLVGSPGMIEEYTKKSLLYRDGGGGVFEIREAM